MIIYPYASFNYINKHEFSPAKWKQFVFTVCRAMEINGVDGNTGTRCHQNLHDLEAPERIS